MHNIYFNKTYTKLCQSAWVNLGLTLLDDSFRAIFTKSLCQHKPSFGVKTLLSGFTKDMHWNINNEKACSLQLFLQLILLHLHLYEFQMASLSEEQGNLLKFAVVSLLVFTPYLTPKKACLNAFCTHTWYHQLCLFAVLWKFAGCICFFFLFAYCQ